MDSGRIKCADYVFKDVQNAFNEGYTTNVQVTNLFVFDSHGCLIRAALNYPGRYHDWRLYNMFGLMYPKLRDERAPPGYTIACDSAFIVRNSTVSGKLVRARKRSDCGCRTSSWEAQAVDLVLQRVHLSERKSAEWGVRTLKGRFARLQFPLSVESERRRVLICCAHQLKFRTRVIGLSNIRTTYCGNQGSKSWMARAKGEVANGNWSVTSKWMLLTISVRPSPEKVRSTSGARRAFSNFFSVVVELAVILLVRFVRHYLLI